MASPDVFAGQILPGVFFHADNARDAQWLERLEKLGAERRKHFSKTNCQSRVCIF